ncbi:hypothetical protein ACWDAO_04150 [Streptomyces sp. NPDC001212]
MSITSTATTGAVDTSARGLDVQPGTDEIPVPVYVPTIEETIKASGAHATFWDERTPEVTA